MSEQEQRSPGDRKSGKPVVSILADRYSRRSGFCPTGTATRSELAEDFFENAREAAKDYTDMKKHSRPAPWNDFTRDAESRMWMHKHHDERTAWAKSIDLLWRFSDGEDVDADALREALVRMSLRRHRDGSRRDRNEEHIFVKAAAIVREKAGLDRMADAREDAIHEDYREVQCGDDAEIGEEVRTDGGQPREHARADGAARTASKHNSMR